MLPGGSYYTSTSSTIQGYNQSIRVDPDNLASAVSQQYKQKIVRVTFWRHRKRYKS